jgi:hypothetical protein
VKKVILPLLLAMFTGSNLVLNMAFSRHTANAQSSQTAIKWSVSQLEATKKNCANAMVKALDKLNQKVPMQIVNSYCGCITQTVAQRYELADFVKNDLKYLQKLEKEGKVNQCLKVAQATK